MSDLKVSLKEAKNAIKDKDYEAAMIHCKDALKIDRKNYQALAMLGRVCIEERRFTDSKKALLLATQVEPENPVAWQGLSNLHDKKPDVFDKEEEISILDHLKTITKDEEKLKHLYSKLADVYVRHGSLLDAISVLEELVSVLTSENSQKNVRKSIIELLENDGGDATENITKQIENYKCLLNQSELGENESNYQKYLRLLYKAKRIKELVQVARAMSEIFPTDYPLEWIARIYVESSRLLLIVNSKNYIDDNLVSDEEISKVTTRLLSIHPASPWGNLAQGLIYYKEKNYENSKRNMRKGCDALSTNVTAWLMYLSLLEISGDISGIEAVCSRLTALVESSQAIRIPDNFPTIEDFKRHLLLAKVNALFKLGRTRNLEEVVTVLKNVDKKDVQAYIMLIKSQVKLNLVDEACRELEALKNEYGDGLDVQRIIALVASAKGDHNSAKAIYEDIVKEYPNNADALFELGKINYEAEDYQNALVLLLKAAKFDPNMSSAFLYIGHYYRFHDNLEKARKCYEKALSLNPSCVDSGLALSDVYRITGQNEANFSLLVRVTQEGKSDWAWLRLGLQYMAVKDYDESIKALQRSIELCPKDRIAYDCLGDAYLARGSYSAALKVFTKAIELAPSEALYPRCQIAHINNLVGDFLMSISQYESVLAESLPDAVRTVALVGLSEVLLTRAKKYGQEKLLSNMKGDCLYAIKCLTRSASENPKTITIWKLLGDACTLQAPLPPSLSTFRVPTRLLDPSVNDMELTSDIGKNEILQLGARCYGVGLQINKDNAALWHDLGVNLFLQGYYNLKLSKESKYLSDDDQWNGEEMKEDFSKRALAAVKKSLSIDSRSFNAWNSYGVISYFKEDLPLAQHSFIQSLLLHPSVEAWTHLGALYLHQDDVQLAHEAFSQAQALDPGFVASWVGQAMVATSVGHYEAFDLFRHTTQLGIHPESCIGFGSGVLKLACDPTGSSEASKVIKFLTNAMDSLTFYTREKEEDVVAHTMLAVTLDMLDLHHSAFEVLSKALQICHDQSASIPVPVKDLVLGNLGRVSTCLGKIPEAIAYFTQMKEPNFYSQCGLALAKLKACQYEESYQTYTEACDWFAVDDAQKSHVFAALAFLYYKFGKMDDVKTNLFQSCSISSSIQSRLALTGLGLIQGDAVLTDAALAEILPATDHKEFVADVAFMRAAQHTLQSNYHEAKLILCRAIHRHPHNSALWRSLSHHLLSFPSEESSKMKTAKAANAAASSARVLAQADGDNDKVLQDVLCKATSHLKVAQSAINEPKNKKKGKGASKSKETSSVQERKRESLVEAQRAVLMCPSRPETWAVLVAAIDSKPKKCALARKWMRESEQPLKSWFESIYA